MLDVTTYFRCCCEELACLHEAYCHLWCDVMLPDTWCHITEVANLNWDCCDNIKSHHVSICVLCSHSLLDAKINSVLSVCNDPVILNAVQAIIQNMICSEDTSQQQLHYLQSCGFGGLWRFAGPFTKVIVIVHEDCCVVRCDDVQSSS